MLGRGRRKQLEGGDEKVGKDSAPDGDDLDNEWLTARQVRDRWDRGMEETADARRAYWVNFLFTKGEQWLRYSRTLDRFDRIPNDGRVQVVDNRILPAQRTILGKLLKRPLVFEVMPSGADDASLRGARLGEAVLRHTYREQGWEQVRSEHVLVTWKGGTGGVCIDWDPDAGVSLGFDPDTGRTFGTGTVKLTALSVAEMVTEPGCRRIRTGGWWIKGLAVPPQTAKQMYGLDELPPPDAGAGAPLSTALTSLDSRQGGRGSTHNLCLVLTCYQRPQKGVKGQVVTVIADKVVDRVDWPFPFEDHLNIDVAVETEVEGQWFGDTVVTQAIQPQVSLNMTRSAHVEHMLAVGNAKPMTPMGSIDRIDEVTDDPTEWIEYLPTPGGGKPEYLTPPNMPTWWSQNHLAWYATIDDILNTHAISRGEAPPNVDAGVALSLLAEQDDTPVGMLAGGCGDMWGRIGGDVLRMLADNVTESRQALVHKDGTSRPETAKWTGRDLHDQTDVDVPRDAVMPRSRQAQVQLAMNLASQGIFGTPPDPVKMFRFAELQGAEDAVSRFDPDLVRAERENDDMASAETVDELANVPIPRDFDNHATHIRVHNDFRKSGRYERLPAEVQEVVDLHVKVHESFSMMEMQAQATQAVVDPAGAVAAKAHEPPLAGEPLPPEGAQPGMQMESAGGANPWQPPDSHTNTPGGAGPQGPELMPVPMGGNPQ